MARILVLTDRPQEDERVISLAVELADRLDADGVAAVVTRSENSVLPSGMLFGIPDCGLLPQDISPSSLSMDGNDVAAAERFAAHQSRANRVAVFLERLRSVAG